MHPEIEGKCGATSIRAMVGPMPTALHLRQKMVAYLAETGLIFRKGNRPVAFLGALDE